jgi:predicted O-methyltransferase YrrM
MAIWVGQRSALSLPFTTRGGRSIFLDGVARCRYQCKQMSESQMEDCFALMRTLMEYRHQPISSRLREMRHKHSMLHEDVLLLIYHFSKTTTENILEIGPYLGGSTIAAGIGTREAGQQRKIVTVEPGGAYKHPRLPSKDILRDLRKNLAKQGVADLVTVIEGYSGNENTVAAVHETLPARSVGFCIIDADGGVERDIGLYRDLLIKDCPVVIDDYYSPKQAGKTVRIKPQVDALVAAGELETLGFYGWGTWIGRWRGEKL